MNTILNGKELAQERKELYKERVSLLKEFKISPKLVVIIVGDDASSLHYVNNKIKYCNEVGVESQVISLPSSTTEDVLIEKINELNKDTKVHGLLVQLPLPKHINEFNIKCSISPDKDVDCFTPENTGLFYMGKSFTAPCTPSGVIELLNKHKVDVSGKKAVILGRSLISGKPMAELLNQLNATTTIMHSKTPDYIMREELKNADIIVSAIGKANYIKPDMIGTHQILIDIGINVNEDGKLCGDFDKKCYDLSSYYTPVPGGVGPMTVSMLIENTIRCAAKKAKI